MKGNEGSSDLMSHQRNVVSSSNTNTAGNREVNLKRVGIVLKRNTIGGSILVTMIAFLSSRNNGILVAAIRHRSISGGSLAFAPSHHGGCSSLLSRTRKSFVSKPFVLSDMIPKKEAYSCLHSSSSTHDDDSKQNKIKKEEVSNSNKKKQPKKKSKFKINPRWKTEADLSALSEAFDEMAKKEGFDKSSAFFADDDSFEDDFDKSSALFTDDGQDDLDFDDDDDINFSFPDENGSGAEESMASRIAAAKRDMSTGKITIPSTLSDYSQSVSPTDLRKLGFKPELNPYGNDETPRKEPYKLLENAMTCSGCGADFQSKDDQRPGYLPSDKIQIQIKLHKIEEMQKLQEKAENQEWSPEDEIDWLIQSSENPTNENNSPDDPNYGIDIPTMASKLDLDLASLPTKNVICKRCHGLQNYGKVEASLRPGHTDEPLLSQENFRKLLEPLKHQPAVIIALVDLFDFSGSVLPDLDTIVGEDNPVILAANKADLLPSEMGQLRAENWVRRELEYLGIQCLANVGGAVSLVSCRTGYGVTQLLNKARTLAEEMECDIYVVGAANAGKSTLMNFILEKPRPWDKNKPKEKKKRAGDNTNKGAITTSPLPGTTLKFIKVDLKNGIKLYDTPGLLVPGTLTQMLTPEELKIVVPKKKVEPITFRVSSGKCVLIGGLGRVEIVGDSKPFLLTFFVANDIKLHPTDTAKADEILLKNVGQMLTPPLGPGNERLEELGEFESHVIDIEGCGWKEAAADITLRGLGWVAVTGAGVAKVKVSVPKGIGVSVRPPLMPFDIWDSTARYTGGRAVRKATKSKTTGKWRKGVGRR